MFHHDGLVTRVHLIDMHVNVQTTFWAVGAATPLALVHSVTSVSRWFKCWSESSVGSASISFILRTRRDHQHVLFWVWRISNLLLHLHSPWVFQIGVLLSNVPKEWWAIVVEKGHPRTARVRAGEGCHVRLLHVLLCLTLHGAPPLALPVCTGYEPFKVRVLPVSY